MKKRKIKHKKSRRISGMPSIVSGTRHKKSTRKKRRKSKISGITKNPILNMILGMGVGTVVNIISDKYLTKIDQKYKDGGKLVIGGISLAMAKKSDFAKGLGISMLSSGISSGVKSTGLLSGMDQFMSGMSKEDDFMLVEMNGTISRNSTNFIGEGDTSLAPNVISGNEDNTMGDSNTTQPPIVSGY